MYVVCKFTILASTLHSKCALQSGLDTSAPGYRSLWCSVLLIVMCLGYFEKQPNYGRQSFVTPSAKTEKLQACFGLMRPSRGLLLKLFVTLHDHDLSLSSFLFFFLLPQGGGFEWDDDFSSPEPSFISKAANTLISSKPPLQSSKYFSPPPPSRTLDQNWSHSSPYSRFSISPANMASFSLTHLTDSDIEQGGKCFSYNHYFETTHERLCKDMSWI